MSKYADEGRYNVGTQFPTSRPGLTPTQVEQIQGDLNAAPLREITYDPLTVTRHNYPLGPGDFHRFTQGLGVSITGFSGQRAGLQTIVNVDGSTDLTLENNDLGSDATNRILCHTGADITLGPGESVPIRYDYTSSRWRTIGFT